MRTLESPQYCCLCHLFISCVFMQLFFDIQSLLGQNCAEYLGLGSILPCSSSCIVHRHAEMEYTYIILYPWMSNIHRLDRTLISSSTPQPSNPGEDVAWLAPISVGATCVIGWVLCRNLDTEHSPWHLLTVRNKNDIVPHIMHQLRSFLKWEYPQIIHYKWDSPFKPSIIG